MAAAADVLSIARVVCPPSRVALLNIGALLADLPLDSLQPEGDLLPAVQGAHPAPLHQTQGCVRCHAPCALRPAKPVLSPITVRLCYCMFTVFQSQKQWSELAVP